MQLYALLNKHRYFKNFGICVVLISNWLYCDSEIKLMIKNIDVSGAVEASAQELRSARRQFVLRVSALGAGFLAMGGIYYWLGNSKKDTHAASKDAIKAAWWAQYCYDRTVRGRLHKSMQFFFTTPIIMFLGYLLNKAHPGELFSLWPTAEKLFVGKMHSFFVVVTRLRIFSDLYPQQDSVGLKVLMDNFREALLDFIGALLLLRESQAKVVREDIELLCHIMKKVFAQFNFLVGKSMGVGEVFDMCQLVSLLDTCVNLEATQRESVS